jgi:L-histidine Nalpha-methyltransferase
MTPACDLWEASPSRSLSEAFAGQVARGLAGRPKVLSSAWFYDDRGSRLFQQITEQPEYYLTRAEHQILTRYARDIVSQLGDCPVRLIEIGAGDGHKTEVLLREFLAAGLSLEYVPIDICRQSLVDLTHKLRRKLRSPRLAMRGIVADYFDAFPLLESAPPRQNLVLFLGSSIGNFGPRSARKLLAALRKALVPKDLALFGFDLKKDLRVLQAAYDDAAGVTREFNFNLLDRINRELGGRFDRSQFCHHAAYNLRVACMESWLVSRRRQRVRIEALSQSFEFDAWEGIRVERSHKYDLDQIEAFAASAGYAVRQHYTDDRGWFADSLWEAI